MDSSTATTPSSLTPTAMRFGNDVVIPEPSSNNTQNYSVLTSDAAKQDYQLKNTWLSQEQNNLINQSMLNKANGQVDKETGDANAATKANTDAINGATKALTAGTQTTTASGNSYTSTGDSYNDQLAASNADAAAMYKSTQAALSKASGIAGLSADQQAQLNNLSSQYDNLITQQTQANNAYQGGVITSSVRSGADRYAQTVAASMTAQAINEGIAKITKIQNDKASALQKMQSGFISDNVKAVQDAYKQYQDFVKQQNDAITAMQVHTDKVTSQNLEQQKYNLQIQQQNVKDQQDARDFAVKNNIDKAAYQIGNSIYDTATGAKIDPKQIDPSQIHVIDPHSQAAADYVKTLAGKYGDTVFPTMTPEQAQQAMKYSKLYQKEIRPPSSGSDNLTFKFAKGDVGQLIAAGFSNADIPQLQSDLQKYGIDKVTEGMSDTQKKALQAVVGGASYAQEQKAAAGAQSKLTREHISSLFGIADNNEKDNILGIEHGQTNKEKLDDIMNTIKKYQDIGLSDADIIKKLEQ